MLRQITDTVVVALFIAAAFLLGAYMQFLSDNHFTEVKHEPQAMSFAPKEVK